MNAKLKQIEQELKALESEKLGEEPFYVFPPCLQALSDGSVIHYSWESALFPDECDSSTRLMELLEKPDGSVHYRESCFTRASDITL